MLMVCITSSQQLLKIKCFYFVLKRSLQNNINVKVISELGKFFGRKVRSEIDDDESSDRIKRITLYICNKNDLVQQTSKS